MATWLSFLPSNIAARARKYAIAYDNHAARFESTPRTQRGDPRFMGLPWGHFPALPSKIRGIAESPVVATFVGRIPAAMRAPLVSAIIEATDLAYRIPAKTRALAGKVLPQRSNPASAQVNRQNVKNHSPIYFINQYVAKNIPEDVKEWYYGSPSVYDGLSLAIFFAMISPECFPPAPSTDGYNADEATNILRIIAALSPLADELTAFFSGYKREPNFDVPHFKLYDIATARVRSNEWFTPAALEQAIEQVEKSIQYYAGIMHGLQRLPAIRDDISVLRYPDKYFGIYGERAGRKKLMDLAEYLALNAGPELLPIISYAVIRHNEMHELSRQGNFKYGDFLPAYAALLDKNLEYRKKRRHHDEARHAALLELRTAFAPLRELDRAVTLADIKRRLPPGFIAETEREGVRVKLPGDAGQIWGSKEEKWDYIVDYVFKETAK